MSVFDNFIGATGRMFEGDLVENFLDSLTSPWDYPQLDPGSFLVDQFLQRLDEDAIGDVNISDYLTPADDEIYSTEELMELGKLISKDQVQAAFDQSQRVIEANIDRAPQVAERTTGEAIKAATGLNDMMYDLFDETLGNVLGKGWKKSVLDPATMAQKSINQIGAEFSNQIMPDLLEGMVTLSDMATSAVSELVHGNVPSVVSQRVQEYVGPVGMAYGVDNLVPQDIGLTSRDAELLGMSMVGEAYGLAPSATSQIQMAAGAPLTAAAGTANLLRTTLAPTADVGKIMNSMYSGLGFNISPTAAFQSAGSTGVGAFQTMGEFISAEQTSKLNSFVDNYIAGQIASATV